MQRLGFLIVVLIYVSVCGLETAPPGKEPGDHCYDQKCPPDQGMNKNLGKMADKLKLVIFLGSAREGRLGERVKRFVLNNLNTMDKYKDKYNVVVYDPVEKEFPLLKKAFHYYEDKSTAPLLLQEANADIVSADAFLLISCEYNHSIPPALSNMLGHFPASSYALRPSALLTYSPSQFGGIRAAMQLRAMTGELGCISVSKIFAIPKVDGALDKEGTPTEKDSRLNDEFDALMEQLEWVAVAFKDKKKKDEQQKKTGANL